MKKYDSYKDSGIEWIGEIPSNWKIKRIDWVTKIVRGNTGFKKDELLNTGEYVALQYGKTYKVDVVDDGFNFFVNNEFFNESQITTKGDTILISTSETIEDLGHTCFYDNNNIGLLGGEQILLKPNREFLHEKYLYHYSRQFGSELKRYAKGLKVFRYSTNDLKRLFIAVPTIEEQNAIANFLDHKTAHIDVLISKKKCLIQLLEEERTAIINQAVTKGLDPTVPMKYSGIEWLGVIPEHWEVTKIKAITQKIGSGITPKGGAEIYELSGIPLLRSQNIYFDGFHLENVAYITTEIHQSMKNSQVYSGDVLLNITGGSIGRCFYVTNEFEEANVNQHVCIVRPNEKIETEFLYYFLSSAIGQLQIDLCQTGGNREALNFEQLKNFYLVLPSINEQRELLEKLKFSLQKISETIENSRKEIELIKEYKIALISEVVTGKVDVRDYSKN